MGNGPAPFSDIGKRAKDLLTKDYNYDHKFTFSVPSSTGMGLTATGVKRDQIFVGDISTQYKRGNTTVDVKVDTYSNVCTKVTMNDILPSTKAAFSFDIPDHKSGKLDVQYLHDHAAINSSIGLNPAPLLEVAAALGNKDLFFGGEIGFDTASASFTKHNAGIGFNKKDFSVALILTARDGERLWLRVIGKAKKKRLPDMDLSNPPVLKLLNRVQCLFSVEITLMDKGQTLKASYIHTVNPLTGTEVAAEMTHRFSKYENSFTIGSSHTIDPCTTIKTRFSDNGKVAMLCQREWRPKSLVTFSAEYDSKAINAAPKLGLALALKP